MNDQSIASERSTHVFWWCVFCGWKKKRYVQRNDEEIAELLEINKRRTKSPTHLGALQSLLSKERTQHEDGSFGRLGFSFPLVAAKKKTNHPKSWPRSHIHEGGGAAFSMERQWKVYGDYPNKDLPQDYPSREGERACWDCAWGPRPQQTQAGSRIGTNTHHAMMNERFCHHGEKEIGEDWVHAWRRQMRA